MKNILSFKSLINNYEFSVLYQDSCHNINDRNILYIKNMRFYLEITTSINDFVFQKKYIDYDEEKLENKYYIEFLAQLCEFIGSIVAVFFVFSFYFYIYNNYLSIFSETYEDKC